MSNAQSLTQDEAAERAAHELEQLEHYVVLYRNALIKIVVQAPANGEDVSFLIAKDALS